MDDTERNVDSAEVDKFSTLADAWWAPDGPSRTLHHINSCRTEFITNRTALAGAAVLDVGCGGGILTEALAQRGGRLTGIDATPAVIEVAHEHAARSALAITYQVTTAESHVSAARAAYDAVVCMELIEHVPSPQSLLEACAHLLRSGGDFFLSTINRSPRAYVEAVFGAEYLLRLLPIGTHDYARFITPAEIAALLRTTGFEVLEIRGMRYNPLTRRATLSAEPRVNYLVHARRS